MLYFPGTGNGTGTKPHRESPAALASAPSPRKPMRCCREACSRPAVSPLPPIPSLENMALIVFDPQRPQQLDFKHLLYFPPDARYAVKARLEKFPEKREVKITTTRKLEKTFIRYARIHFQVAGRELALTALKSSLEGPDSEYLFIPFKDATNGKETYEVGRFIDLPEPQGEEFILDFNRCYNPLCNYSPAYNCPLPPLENFLDVAVPAGEKDISSLIRRVFKNNVGSKFDVRCSKLKK